MTTALVSIAAALAAAFWLRHWGEANEALRLRTATALLRPTPEEHDAPSPERVKTGLERTRMALCAAKTARILALFILYPACVLVVRELGVAAGIGDPWNTDGRTALSLGLALALAVFLALLLMHARAVRKNPLPAEGERVPLPDWLTHRERQAPIAVLVGNMVWEKVHDAFDWAYRPLNADRPQAQLFERDNQIRLALSTDEHRIGPPKSDSDTARSENEMVRSIGRLRTTFVREIMRPINHVTAVRLADCTPRRFLDLARRSGYTRIPVYEEQVTSLVGYVNIYDILDADEMPQNLRELVAPALFIPETARVDAVLGQMIQRKQQVAIVFDEFGATSGWLSREDILEEIVGEVQGELERPRRMYFEVKGGWIVDPSADIDDLREEIGLDVPKTNCDTIAGYVYARLGRVPRRGETLVENGWSIKVAAVEGHRIRRIRLTPPHPDEEDSA